MDLLNNLALGFGVVFQFVDLKIAFLNITIPFPMNIFLCFVGAMVGTLIGVLPGIGPLATIAMLLPITFGLPPVGALIMLAGIYYGAQYGGSTTSILINIPGESSSVVTALDGHQMARQGRAGPALAIAAIGSFIAGTFATVLVAALGVPLTAVALQVRPGGIFLADGARARVRGRAGARLGAQGARHDPDGAVDVDGRLRHRNRAVAPGVRYSGTRRRHRLRRRRDGRVRLRRDHAQPGNDREPRDRAVQGHRPDADRKGSQGSAAPAIARGTLLGSILGILPGGGAVIAAFAAYTFEKKMSSTPERFGHGAIEGVAAPESANNAAAQTSFIPLLTLGIPPNAVMALMVGAMTIHGIVPGPQVMTKQPELFWGLIASMWVGNLMLVVINLPLVGLWVRLLRVPYRMLFPAILIFCAIGVYSINNAPADAVMVAAFGLVGYWLIKHDFEPAPMLLGFVLGPLMEENLRRAMLIARGDPSTFFTRPISGVLLALAMLLLVLALLPMIRKKRDEVFVEEST